LQCFFGTDELLGGSNNSKAEEKLSTQRRGGLGGILWRKSNGNNFLRVDGRRILAETKER
jgi:hypothetical protein